MQIKQWFGMEKPVHGTVKSLRAEDRAFHLMAGVTVGGTHLTLDNYCLKNSQSFGSRHQRVLFLRPLTPLIPAE